MATDSKTILAYIGGGFIVALVGGFTMLGFQKLLLNPSTPAPATTVAAAPAAPAAPAYPMAQVVNVQPHYVSYSVPYRACYQVARTIFIPQPEYYPGAGTVIGGVAGGVLGNQIGEGRGRTVATIGGALLGALAGNGVQESMNQPQPNTIYETHCRTKYAARSRQQGYNVTYVYNGQQGVMVMPVPPASNMIPLPNGMPMSGQ